MLEMVNPNPLPPKAKQANEQTKKTKKKPQKTKKNKKKKACTCTYMDLYIHFNRTLIVHDLVRNYVYIHVYAIYVFCLNIFALFIKM